MTYTAEREKLVEAGSISSRTSDYDQYNWKRFLADREFIKKPITSITVALLENKFRMMCGDGGKYTMASKLQNSNSDSKKIIFTCLMRSPTINDLAFYPLSPPTKSGSLARDPDFVSSYALKPILLIVLGS